MIIFLRLLINMGALMLLPMFIRGIEVQSVYAAFFAAIVLALVNSLIRPVLQLLTLPLTILTLGFFCLILNALLFWFVASFIDGFAVAGFWPAFWGALSMSVVAFLTNQFLKAR